MSGEPLLKRNQRKINNKMRKTGGANRNAR
jgi:hypothetical protein